MFELSSILLFLVFALTLEYEFKCPVSGEWRLRVVGFNCSIISQYVCLFRYPERAYHETCDGLDYSSTGSKLIYEPFFNKAYCSYERYQPFPFSTDGSSKCLYQKTFCSEKGQYVFQKGSIRSDISCGCDLTRGYEFVSMPKHECYCIPSEEDCSCHKIPCNDLVDQCPKDADEIKTRLMSTTLKENRFSDTINIFDHANNGKKYRFQCLCITSILLAVMIIIVTLFYALYKHLQDAMYKHFKENVELQSGCSYIYQIRNPFVDDDERQRFKLFLKGESKKLYYARVILIGKNGVGKTSLMRRLLRQNIDDITSIDGITVEQCNINIASGEWSPCNKLDDDLNRLVHQVYKEKKLNVGSVGTITVFDQKPLTYQTYESNRASDKEFLKSSTDSEGIEILNDDTYRRILKGYESDDTIGNVISRQENDLVKDECINKMTSTIIESYLQCQGEERDDMLASCWLWDFAGRKEFYATHQVFLSKYAIYLLVTDSLEFSTVANQGIDFEGSAQHVSFWLNAIHCYCSTTKKGRLDPPIIVVCTNEDKNKEPIEQEERRKQFSENLRQILNNQEKKSNLRHIYFVSNTEDSDHVFENIRNKISRHAMEMENWGNNYPLKWLLFQQVLLKLKNSNVPISSIQSLLKIAKHKDIDISKDNEVKQCLQLCHDIGTVVYFDEENLADYVILDPNWLVYAFTCLVSGNTENDIRVSDDWHQLEDTGQLKDSLISHLFKKKPKLKFEDNKKHIIEVMKRFDVIVNLKDSTELYMPCMMMSCSFSEVQKQLFDRRPSYFKTSWLCLEFKCLPPAFFNHVLAWYIKKYHASVIIDNAYRKRHALYRQVGVFDLDPSVGEQQLMVCEGPNIIALQVWDPRMSNTTYEHLGSELFEVVDILRKRYCLDISYTKAFTCKNGDFTINRKSIKDLFNSDFLCLQHNQPCHLSDDLLKPWNH